MNKNVILLLLCIIGFGANVKAQDLIVTQTGDSIPCKILNVENGIFVFNYMEDGAVKKTLMDLEKVEKYQIDYYGKDQLEYWVTENKGSQARFAMQGGYLYRLPDMEDELKSGYNLEAELHVGKPDGVKFGAKMGYSSSNLSVQELDYTMSNFFLGPSVMTSIISKSGKGQFNSAFAAGYLSYKEYMSDGTDYIKATAGTLGLDFSIGYDIRTSDKFAYGISISYNSGALTSVEVTDGSQTETWDLEDDEVIGLARISFTIGIRFM